MGEVRVRFPPSPTGIPHIGNVRTALFNWLFARHNKGKFILRLEDTDKTRYMPESVEKIYQNLEWLGLNWDEGPKMGGPHSPYIQSQRLAIYQKYSQQLVDAGYAYYCFCLPERLEKMRKEQQAKRLPPKYDRTCSLLVSKAVKAKIIKGESHVVRMKVADSGKTSWNDLIHGQISFENKQLDDSVILKSDGFPTYHLAVVVDDYLMKISHVLRGDEWISSTPRHLILYKYLNWQPAKFGHLPVILGPDKSKLSKRHGAKSVLEYHDEGYLKEAIVNFMTLLGWSPKSDQEVFSLDELVKKFDLPGINPTNPIFNLEKLKWFNGRWIRKLSVDTLSERLNPFIRQKVNPYYLKKIIPLIQERLETLNDFENLTGFFFELDQKMFKQAILANFNESDIENLKSYLDMLKKAKSWKAADLERLTREFAQKKAFKVSDVFMTIRIAITGHKATPPLFETLEVLSKDKVFERLENTIKILEHQKPDKLR